MDKKILILGDGHSPTGRSLWLRDRLMTIGFDVEYHSLDAKTIGNQIHTCLVDDEYSSLVGVDFSELERRMENALIYGTSHPEMYWPEPMKEPPPDQRKGPKGPRNRWGKL